MALHGEGELGGTVRPGGLGDSVDQFQQGGRPLGEGLVYLLAELRQTFECVHTR